MSAIYRYDYQRLSAKTLLTTRPLKNTPFWSRSRKVKILNAGVHGIFRGLKFTPDAEIWPKGVFYRGLAALVLAAVISLAPQNGSASERLHRIKRVNDGDTITLTDGWLVRYIGVDTPEIDYEKRRAEAFAYQARDLNRDLLKAGKVRLEFDRQKKDRYGRLLAYVFLKDGTFVNATLLKQGYGFCLPTGKNNRYRSKLLEAQRAAMSAKRGIWKNWQEMGKGYIGNRRSLRLHLKTCPSAARISRTNRVYFKTSWEALWQGYAPARGCMKPNRSK